MTTDEHFILPLDTSFFDDLMTGHLADPTYCHDTYIGIRVSSYSGAMGETARDEGGYDTIMVREITVREKGVVDI